ncbi:NUDIX domain-containing protein [Candidatus Saccharibacteria bacterium CPR2]|nr:NUDIX domain-containing protein [Candidatus Saccharibacteria bacterium CPR2]
MFIRATCFCIKDCKVLVVKQNFPDVDREWSLPGGKVEESETLFEAVVRETKEETGVLVEPKKLLYITESIQKEKHILHILIACDYIEGTTGVGLKLTKNERIPIVKFIYIEELKKLGFANKFINLIETNFPEPVYRGKKENIGL